MLVFSERNGYIKPQTCLIKEDMPKEIINSILSLFDQIREDLVLSHKSPVLDKIGLDVWCYLYNRRRDEYEDFTIISNDLRDENILWYKKIDLLEFIIDKMYSPNYAIFNLGDSFVRKLNSEFERLRYGYRIVGKLVVPITSDEEIKSIEQAIDESSDNIKTHLNSALKLFADRENPDYSNSIKESISAVEAFLRDLTSENTYGKALNSLENMGVLIQTELKKAMNMLYAYTNQPETGIRHALIEEAKEEAKEYRPSYEEAYFMLITCSAFVNYLRGKFAKVQN